MVYKLAVLEDDLITYEDVMRKTKENKSLLCFNHSVERFVSETPLAHYVKMIKENPSDIYIVDWELKFSSHKLKTVESVFNELKENEVPIEQSFWIFYSDKSTEVNEFVTRFFNPGNNCYSIKGKYQLTASKRRDHFKEAINEAKCYLDTTRVNKVNLSFGGKTTVSISNFSGKLWDLQKQSKKASISNIEFKLDHFVCLLTNKLRGLLVVFTDDPTPILKFYLVSYGNQPSVVTKKLLPRYSQSLFEGTGFIGHRVFFERDSLKLKSKYQEYVHSVSGIVNSLQLYLKEDHHLEWGEKLIRRAEEHYIIK